MKDIASECLCNLIDIKPVLGAKKKTSKKMIIAGGDSTA